MQIVYYLAATLTLTCVFMLLCLPFLLERSREAERMLELVQSSREDQRKVSLAEKIRTSLVMLARQMRTKAGATGTDKLQSRLAQAGFRGPHAADVFFAAQATAVVLGIALGGFVIGGTLFLGFAGAVVGFMAPDMWLTSRTRGHRQRIQRSIPDAIDLLAICVNAGLGLDQALLRVGTELDVSHPELNYEFERLNLERRAGKPRIEAWRDMAKRTGVEELSAFVTMLAETDRFGTPIATALVSFSEEIRTRRRQRAEEAAAKTKIKIIFPLVLCIFPCIFIVLLAPAILSIMDGLGGLGR